MTLFVFVGFATPDFWLALLLMILFGVQLGWLPISGLRSLNFEYLSSWGQAWDILAHLILPVNDEAEASAVAGTVFADPELALSTMVREEIGMDMKSIGSPMVAATGSFIAFVLGAIIPVIPYLLTSGTAAFVASLALGLVALFFLGVAISRFTGRSWLFSGARQVALGGVAAAVTYFVGAAIGATV
jgi:hypothetical protein